MMRLARGTRVRISTAHALHADQQRDAGQEGTLVGLCHWQGGVQYMVRFADGRTATFYPLYIEAAGAPGGDPMSAARSAQQAVIVGSATTTPGYTTTVYEARRPQQCSRCGQPIPAGANFVRRRQHGEDYATFPVCLHCCPIREINPAGGRLKPYRCSSCGRLAPQRTWRFVADAPAEERFPWRSECCGAILKRG